MDKITKALNDLADEVVVLRHALSIISAPADKDIFNKNGRYYEGARAVHFRAAGIAGKALAKSNKRVREAMLIASSEKRKSMSPALDEGQPQSRYYILDGRANEDPDSATVLEACDDWSTATSSVFFYSADACVYDVEKKEVILSLLWDDKTISSIVNSTR